MSNQIQSFYDKLLFYSSFKQFKFKKMSLLKKIEKICKGNPKSFSTFEILTLLSHFDLIYMLNYIIDFELR